MPAHEDWVLYGPSLDRSLVRDALAYELARLQGAQSVAYCGREQCAAWHVELGMCSLACAALHLSKRRSPLRARELKRC